MGKHERRAAKLAEKQQRADLMRTLVDIGLTVAAAAEIARLGKRDLAIVTRDAGGEDTTPIGFTRQPD